MTKSSVKTSRARSQSGSKKFTTVRTTVDGKKVTEVKVRTR